MAWTTPKTYVANDPLTAAELNTYQRDNMNALHTPASAQYELDEGFDYTTNSTSFVNIDGTILSFDLTTAGRKVLVGATLSVLGSTTLNLYLNVDVDGVKVADNDGICVKTLTSTQLDTMTFVYLIDGLSAGDHTFKLQWKVSTGTATLYAGAGTSGGDVHPQFFAHEI